MQNPVIHSRGPGFALLVRHEELEKERPVRKIVETFILGLSIVPHLELPGVLRLRRPGCAFQASISYRSLESNILSQSRSTSTAQRSRIKGRVCSSAVLVLLVLDEPFGQCKVTQSLELIQGEFELPGLAVARVKDCAVTKEVAGFQKRGDDTKIQSSDEFHTGSNTKAMTAALIGVFVDQGRLRWDTTLQQIFTRLANRIPRGQRDTTIAMLGAYQKGKYFYGNTNYAILGSIIKNFFDDGSKSREDIFSSHLFEPLKMDCDFGAPPESSETSVDNP
ncbi:hypothetical protein AJ80_00329 [Polytolypa hystricis UAMH7299]|uniref:Beta-lactamase-related domain-containing protein n=1 Tax=Polytolypa hystricis (strain UAMH7299) TaxID=1447883 RepID=A0A2B7Z4A9_POLH7|nr:hypothetical protein AJ80_00329 [Polytolypa hystricis UAMH7299]